MSKSFEQAFLALGAMAVLGCASSARAQAKRGFTACDSARTTLEGRACRTSALAALEATTIAFEDSVFRRLDSAVTRPLRHADVAWLEYRNAECAAVSGTESGGSIVPVLDLQCRIDRTAERLQYLQAVYRPWLKP